MQKTANYKTKQFFRGCGGTENLVIGSIVVIIQIALFLSPPASCCLQLIFLCVIITNVGSSANISKIRLYILTKNSNETIDVYNMI